MKPEEIRDQVKLLLADAIQEMAEELVRKSEPAKGFPASERDVQRKQYAADLFRAAEMIRQKVSAPDRPKEMAEKEAHQEWESRKL